MATSLGTNAVIVMRVPCIFLAISQGKNFFDFMFAFLNPICILERGLLSKRIEFAGGANSFLLD